MTSASSPTPMGDNDYTQQHQQHRKTPSQTRPTDVPDSFVLGPHFADRSRSNTSQRVTNAVGQSSQMGDMEYKLSLLQHLSQDLGNLLNRTDISDCFLNVDGTFMAVHKCILAARSNAFAAVISGNFNRLETDTRKHLQTMTEKDKLVISITKTHPEIMKQVVIFMYTGKCDLSETNAYDLLDAAGRYDIKDLKVHTGRYLASRINTDSVLMLLEAAYKYDNKLVKQRCIEYFINHAKEIMDRHSSWKPFAERQQVIVAELLHWLVNKEIFYSEKPQWEVNSRW